MKRTPPNEPLVACRGTVPLLRDTPPEVFASAYWHATGHSWALSIVCPHCGQMHDHGGGSDPEPALGHRLSHCLSNTPNPGYVLVTEPTGSGVDALQVGQRVTMQLIGQSGEICRGDITAIEPHAVLLAGLETWTVGERRRHRGDELIIFRDLIGGVTIEREARALAS